MPVSMGCFYLVSRGILPLNALNVASNLWLLPLVFTLDGNDANCKRQTFAGKNKSLYARSV